VHGSYRSLLKVIFWHNWANIFPIRKSWFYSLHFNLWNWRCVCLEGLWNTTEYVSQISYPTGWDFKPLHPKYEAEW